MDKAFKRLAFAALGGVFITAISAFVYAGGNIDADYWGFPAAYFEKFYPAIHGDIFILWPQAVFDFLVWFSLCMVVVIVSLAWSRTKPTTRYATVGQ
jgi:hypothetical protein